jgi:hypothetical protein
MMKIGKTQECQETELLKILTSPEEGKRNHYKLKLFTNISTTVHYFYLMYWHLQPGAVDITPCEIKAQKYLEHILDYSSKSF